MPEITTSGADRILTITNPTPYRCVGVGCKQILCVVEGRKIGFPLMYGYTIVVELKAKQQFEPINCPKCGFVNHVRGAG